MKLNKWSEKLEAEWSLNEVRPGRPEQLVLAGTLSDGKSWVSMKSGLEDRNNKALEKLSCPMIRLSQ